MACTPTNTSSPPSIPATRHTRNVHGLCPYATVGASGWHCRLYQYGHPLLFLLPNQPFACVSARPSDAVTRYVAVINPFQQNQKMIREFTRSQSIQDCVLLHHPLSVRLSALQCHKPVYYDSLKQLPFLNPRLVRQNTVKNSGHAGHILRVNVIVKRSWWRRWGWRVMGSKGWAGSGWC
jgi:hypothetical protein